MTLAAESLVVCRNGATLLDSVSLSLPGSGSVAVIGPNGAGKSTLVRALAGLERPTVGRVELRGRDLASLDGETRARRIGFMPQSFAPHWDLSVADLLELGAARAGNSTGLALVRARAEIERSLALDGLGARRWSTLSGGEQARVLLATVLVVDPPILLADEPAAALDIRHRLDVLRRLATRGRERLSVVVVHDLDLAFGFFQRVVLLAGGRIVADAPAVDLIGDPCLDAAFGVRFERLRLEKGWVLRAADRED